MSNLGRQGQVCYIIAFIPTVFDLADVADDDLFDKYLYNLAVTYDAQSLFAFDLSLKTAKLSLLPPVIERRHEDDGDHCRHDRCALNPARLRLRLIVASCTNQTL